MKIPGRPAAAAALSTAAVVAALLVPTSASAVAPGAPTALSPNDASATQYKNLELHWAAVAGADSYEIQVSDDGDFERGELLKASSKTSSWVVPVTLPRGDYSYRVRSVKSGATSAWTEGAFTRGWADRPAWTRVGVEAGTQATSFQWQPIPDASFYEVEVIPARADGSNPLDGEPDGTYQGTTLPHYTCYTTHTFFAPYGSSTEEKDLPGDEGKCYVGATGIPRPVAAGTLVPLGGLTVQVDATASTHAPSTSIVAYTFDFGDGSAPVTRVDPLSPAHSYPVAGTYAITVTVTDAAGQKSKAFAVPAVVPAAAAAATDPAGTADTPPTLDTSITPGVYWWRVRGRDGTLDTSETPFAAPTLACTGVWDESGATLETPGPVVHTIIGYKPPSYLATPECSAWSSMTDRLSSQFTIGRPGTSLAKPTQGAANLQVQPTTGDPAAAVVAVSDTPILGWDAYPGADKYRVYVSRTADLRDADHVYETNATHLQPVSAYADRSLKSYWAVQICTGNTECGPISAVHSFVKNSPVTIQDTQTDVAGKLATLSWTTPSGATRSAQDQGVSRFSEAKGYELQAALEGDWSNPVTFTAGSPAVLTDTTARGCLTPTPTPTDAASPAPTASASATPQPSPSAAPTSAASSAAPATGTSAAATSLKVDRIAAPGDLGQSHATVDISQLRDGRYSWRVRPLDDANHPLKWSAEVGTFVRNTTVPSASLATGDLVDDAPLNISLSEPVVDPTSRSIAIAARSNGHRVEGVLESVSLTCVQFTPTRAWVANEGYKLVLKPSVQDRAHSSFRVSQAFARADRTLDSAGTGLLKRMSGGATLSVRTASDAIGKSFVSTSVRAKGTVLLTGVLRGRQLVVAACKSPRSGQLSIGVDGKHVTTVDLYRSYSGCQVVWTSSRLTDRQHTLQLVALTTKNTKSKGTEVGIDAVSAH